MKHYFTKKELDTFTLGKWVRESITRRKKAFSSITRKERANFEAIQKAFLGAIYKFEYENKKLKLNNHRLQAALNHKKDQVLAWEIEIQEAEDIKESMRDIFRNLEHLKKLGQGPHYIG